MATSIGATAAAAATTSASAATATATATRNVLNSSKCLPLFRHHYYSQSHPKLNLKLRFSSSKDLHSNWNHSVVAKAQLNKVSVDGSSNAAPGTPPESEVSSASNDVKLSSETSPAVLVSISEFLSQVSTLVKLVDSRDIAELKLKQLDCELIIRKKEALLQPPSAAPPPHTPPVQSHYMPAIQPSALPSSVPAPPPVPGPVQAPLPQKTKPSESSLPPLKCPMAGTFYRSPGPSEPPFVKVGDKVQKGQVLCIIEAMKLMNEIEADKSGTIVEILAEDGKPVSVDTPLFVIKP